MHAKAQKPIHKTPPSDATTKSKRAPAGESNLVWRRLATRVQPKLKAGAANDAFEREADQVADRVMRMPEPHAESQVRRATFPFIQHRCSACEQEEQREPDAAVGKLGANGPATIQREFQVNDGPADAADSESVDIESFRDDGLHRESDSVESDIGTDAEPAADGMVQRRVQQVVAARPPPIQATSATQNWLTLQREPAASAVGGDLSDSSASEIRNSMSGGEPLSDSDRAYFEPRFGRDLSQVRLHRDNASASLADGLNARAFTLRNHIFFNRGQHGASDSGRRLLAHELTHTIQQGSVSDSPAAVQRRTPPPTVQHSTGPRVQRVFGKLAEKAARYIPGYDLISLIIGRTPISGRKVNPTGRNILKAVLGLIPLWGPTWFDQLEKSKQADKAGAWIDGRLKKLNITWKGIQDLVAEFKRRRANLGYIDRWRPSKLKPIAVQVFAPTWQRITAFLSAVKEKIKELIIEGVLSLAGKFGKQVMKFLKQAGGLFSMIYKDPAGFASNVVGAIVGGFQRFGKNIGQHLMKGLLGWLLGTMSQAGINIPKQFNLQTVGILILELLNLTWTAFRQMLVKRIGEKKVMWLERSVAFVRLLAREGTKGLAKLLLQKGSNLIDTVLGALRNWVITQVVKTAVLRLATMVNPAGALFTVLQAVYRFIEVFIQQKDRILSIMGSLYGAVKGAAEGKTAKASEFVEKTLSRALPVAIGFLAGFLNLGDVATVITSTIRRLGARIGATVRRVVTAIVKRAGSLLTKHKTARSNESRHRILANKVSKQFELNDGPDSLNHDQWLKYKRRVADKLEKDSVRHLQKGIRLRILIRPTAKQKRLDFRVRIAPNTTETPWKRESPCDTPEECGVKLQLCCRGVEVLGRWKELAQHCFILVTKNYDGHRTSYSGAPEGAVLKAYSLPFPSGDWGGEPAGSDRKCKDIEKGKTYPFQHTYNQMDRVRDWFTQKRFLYNALFGPNSNTVAYSYLSRNNIPVPFYFHAQRAPAFRPIDESLPTAK